MTPTVKSFETVGHVICSILTPAKHTIMTDNTATILYPPAVSSGFYLEVQVQLQHPRLSLFHLHAISLTTHANMTIHYPELLTWCTEL